MTGYDKSPDYGGPPVTRWTILGWLIFALGVGTLALWAAH